MWEDCLLEMLRVLINDMDSALYSDERLLQVIKAAAYYVNTDLSCCAAIAKPELDECGDFVGDPLEYPPFANLVLLRAACLVDQGTLRTRLAAEGVKAVCGPVSMQVMGGSSSFQILLDQGPCASYNSLKDDLCFRCPIQSAAYCTQVISLGIDSCWTA